MATQKHPTRDSTIIISTCLLANWNYADSSNQRSNPPSCIQATNRVQQDDDQPV